MKTCIVEGGGEVYCRKKHKIILYIEMKAASSSSGAAEAVKTCIYQLWLPKKSTF